MNFEYKIYFGRSVDPAKAGYSYVTTSSWDEFVNNEILPRFGGGFTVQDANGVWKGGGERVKLVTIIGSAIDAVPVYAIAQAYSLWFHQDAVLITETKLGGPAKFIGKNGII